MMKKRLFAALCALCLILVFPAHVMAQAHLEVSREERFSSFVEMPVLSGLSDLSIQEAINADILRIGGFESYRAIIGSLADENATGIQVQSYGIILKNGDQPLVLSITVEASGRIAAGRPGHQAWPLVFSLENGRALSAQDIFVNVTGAQQALDSRVEEHLAPEMSSYLDEGALLPLPISSFSLDDAGITFHYPFQQLTMLSGKSGSINFHYNEIASLLDLREGAILWKLGIHEQMGIRETTKGLVAAIAGDGTLPGLSVHLKDSADEILRDYPLLVDSEAFPGGVKYYLEDARFRGTALIAQEGTQAQIIGILSYRMNLAGIMTGQTSRAQTMQALGAPSISLPLDTAAAEIYGLVEGELDTYFFGGHELALSFDEDQLLQVIWLKDKAE